MSPQHCNFALIIHHQWLERPTKVPRSTSNFLNTTQRTLSDICADKTKADMRFSSNEWLYEPRSTPYLNQCEMIAFCEVDNIVIQFTHTVAFPTVAKANVSQNIQ